MIFADSKYLRALADCWPHQLDRLIGLAGLEPILGPALGANANLRGHWGTVHAWKETSRYDNKTEAKARALYEAITNDPDGVLRWLQMHW